MIISHLTNVHLSMFVLMRAKYTASVLNSNNLIKRDQTYNLKHTSAHYFQSLIHHEFQFYYTLFL